MTPGEYKIDVESTKEISSLSPIQHLIRLAMLGRSSLFCPRVSCQQEGTSSELTVRRVTDRVQDGRLYALWSVFAAAKLKH
jgi:hypothetical protein